MVAINFKASFSDVIKSGEKLQTIRPTRKDGRRPCKVGGALQLYTGMRTGKCRKLADAICTSVSPITIGRHVLDIGGVPYFSSREEFARADGFESWQKLLSWFASTYGDDGGDILFSGYLIRWRLT